MDSLVALVERSDDLDLSGERITKAVGRLEDDRAIAAMFVVSVPDCREVFYAY